MGEGMDQAFNTTIQSLINQYAKEAKVDPLLALNIAEAESTLNPKAVGKAGEIGLYQIHPKYLRYIARLAKLQP